MTPSLSHSRHAFEERLRGSVKRGCLRVIGAALIILTGHCAGRAATINVPADYTTISSAVSAATSGDTIVVAPGTYSGGSNIDIDFGGKNLTIKSSGGAAVTIIDCTLAGTNRYGFIVHQSETAAVIQGFTIENGNSSTKSGGVQVLASTATIDQCIIKSCTGALGGGLYATESGLHVHANVTVTNTIFEHCTGTSRGGAAYVNASNASFSNCDFLANTASGPGGGIEVNDTTSQTVTVSQSNCVFIGNKTTTSDGGAVDLTAFSQLTYDLYNSSFYGNDANHSISGSGTMSFGSENNDIRNCIFWGDLSPAESSTADPPSSNPYQYCDIEQSGYAGSNNNINSDPLYTDPVNNNLMLPTNSPCYAAGTNAVAAGFDHNNFDWPTTASMGAFSREYYTVTASSPQTAGTPFDVTVTVYDWTNSVATGYAGIVHITSSDASATLPADSTLTNGTGIFQVTALTAGTQTLTATDAWTASLSKTTGSITINPGPIDHFTVSAPAQTSAGTAMNFVTVTAYDAYGNVATNYTNQVHITSSDGQAVLPADAALTNGVGIFSVTLKTAGTQTVTATDTGSGPGIRTNTVATGTSSSIEVDAIAATHLGVSAPSTSSAGVAFNVTVTAIDPYGNTDTNYGGTVHLSSSDDLATLPSDATLTSGVGTFSVTLARVQSSTVTAMDTVTSSIAGTSDSIANSAGQASSFSISIVTTVSPSVRKPSGIVAHSPPTQETAGVAFLFKVTARDLYGNPTSNYSGTVHFTSNDAGAYLPADSTLHNGVGIFSATLVTAGNHQIVATDTVTSSITGGRTVRVVANVAAHLAVSAPSPNNAGNGNSVTVTAEDQFGNTVSTYSGTVHFSCTDVRSTVPSDTVLTSGTTTQTVTLISAGTWTVTVKDVNTPSINGSCTITALPIGPWSLVVTAPSTVTAGVPFNFTVTALDIWGNVSTIYNGTMHFTGGPGGVSMPADAPITNGVGTFSATFNAAGAGRSITVHALSPDISGSSNSFTVLPGSPGAFTVTPASTAAQTGQPVAFTVTPVDNQGNTVPGYAGTVQLSSTDDSATIPSPVTLTGGVGNFTSVFHQVGSQTITARDGDLSISGTSTGIQVSAPSGTHLEVAAPSTVAVGQTFTATITAKDALGNVVTDYGGTVHLTSDGAGYLGPDAVLSHGVGRFTVRYYRPGSHTITATDTVTGSINGVSNAIAVTSSAVSKLLVYAPSNVVAGSGFNLVVIAVDQYSNQVTGYNGTVKFWSNCPSATMPVQSALVNGRLDTAATMNSAGSYKISAADIVDATVSGTTGSITVAPAAATHFRVVVPNVANSRIPSSFTVQALDASGNVAVGYSGTVHFTSSDGSAVLPGDTTLVNGVRSLPVTFVTGGNQTVTATDTIDGSINGTSSNAMVAAPVALLLTAPATATAGVAFNVTVTAVDQYGRTATGYLGTVQFSSPDSSATMPTNCALVNGVGSFAVIFTSIGSKKVSAWDSVTSSIRGTTGAINVLSPVTHLLVTAPSAVTHGNAFQVTVKAMDQFGVIVTNYTGTVKFTCTDTHAVLPANAPLTNGSGTFNVTMNSVGGRKITVYEVGNSSIKGTSSTITVN